MREFEYVKPLDEKFKQYVKLRKNAKTPKEAMEANAGGFLDENISKVAKDYGCVRLVFVFVFLCYF